MPDLPDGGWAPCPACTAPGACYEASLDGELLGAGLCTPAGPALPDADIDLLADAARHAFWESSGSTPLGGGLWPAGWRDVARAVLAAAQSDAAVERAARALVELEGCVYDDLSEYGRNLACTQARAALAAAWGTT
jgi:hypothetical protein